ncbi:MAG: HAMP domain-containing protein, partial [Melioribacteraceae bacterium]|nr:HAMP domain-containing protein [Melioribacteraceae bacterium]
MKYFKALGIRRKFEIILGVVFMSIAVFLFLYFPLKQKNEMSQALQEKASVMAQMVAKTSSVGLLFDEASSVSTLFEAFGEMADVEFTLVLNNDGEKFAAFSESKYSNYKGQVSDLDFNKADYIESDEVILQNFPVYSGNEKVGNVIVGLNKAQINEFVADSRIISFIMSVVIFIVGLWGIRMFFNRVVYNPIVNLTSIADRVAVGDVDVDIKSDTDDEIGKLQKSFIAILDSVKNQSEIAERISNGDLSKDAKVRSDKDVLSKSMNKVIETLSDLINEISLLTNSAAEGHLSERGNVNKYNGGYKEIVQGINDTLDAVIAPINEGVAALERLSTGDLSVKIDSTYKGDHQLIKNSINTVVESLNKTLYEVSEAIQATASASTQISSSSE